MSIKMPNYIWNYILSYLDLPSLLNFRAASKNAICVIPANIYRRFVEERFVTEQANIEFIGHGTSINWFSMLLQKLFVVNTGTGWNNIIINKKVVDYISDHGIKCIINLGKGDYTFSKHTLPKRIYITGCGAYLTTIRRTPYISAELVSLSDCDIYVSKDRALKIYAPEIYINKCYMHNTLYITDNNIEKMHISGCDLMNGIHINCKTMIKYIDFSYTNYIVEDNIFHQVIHIVSCPMNILFKNNLFEGSRDNFCICDLSICYHICYNNKFTITGPSEIYKNHVFLNYEDGVLIPISNNMFDLDVIKDKIKWKPNQL